MKCKKCGANLDDDAVFCPNCGTKLEETNSTIPTNKEKKKNYIIPLVLVVILLIGFFIFPKGAKEVDLDASDLIDDISNDNTEKFKNSILHVHGYLIRNQTNNGESYILCSSDELNDANIDKGISFTVLGGLDSSIGSGSEITILGELQYDNQNSSAKSILVNDSSDVTVHQCVEPITNIGFIDQLIDSSSEYLNKKVIVTGILVSNKGELQLTDGYLKNRISIRKIDKSNLLALASEGTTIDVTGKFGIDGSDFTIDADSVSINDSYETQYHNQYCSSFTEGNSISVDRLLDNPYCYLNQFLTVYGIIPQSTILDEDGNEVAPLYADDIRRYINLEGDTYPYPWDEYHTYYSGTLTLKNGKLTLIISQFKEN